MAAAMGFSSFITRQSIQSKNEIKYTKRVVERKPTKLYAVPHRNYISNSSSPSPARTVTQFYSAINDKNLKKLDSLIAEDCLYEDYSFPKPFRGKKEVLRFLEQLTTSMGHNMKFHVNHICEGNDYTAGVNWHLDWNKIQVPFTRGCSYYSLLVKGDQLVIGKAQVLIESPIKLGVVALTIFKIVSTLFDAFPAATEWFLKSPHIVFRILLNTCNVCIKPVISPILAWYIKLLNIASSILSFTLKILHYLAKIFNI
ncbi:hypothetical protein ABFX02_05G103400 [Erythranthe guttata]